MPGMSSVSGLISGLKTDDIITKMMDIARQPQQQIQSKKAVAQQKLAAWQDINTRVLALKMKCDSISAASAFQAKSASSSDKDVVNVSASPEAMTGSYYIKVTSRAQSHQLSSQSFSSTDANIGTGKVNISLASGSNFEVNIDSKNNTLSGLKDAINNAKDNKGVQAVIINSGTSSEPQYKLLLTSTNSGSQNAMTVTNTLTGGVAPLINNQVQAATDAVVELGEGAGKITVTKSTNSINDLIPGVTLNIGNPNADKTIKIDVTRDTNSISSAVEGFVGQYNDLISAIDKQFDFDSQSGATGTLFGDYQLQSIQTDILSMVNNTVTGVSSKFNALSAVGITMDTSGRLLVDSSRLTTALNTNADDVARLFSAGIQSDSSYVTYIASSGNTKPSGTDGWTVNVTQAATRSQATAGVAFGSDVEGVMKLAADETLTINSVKINLTQNMTLTDAINEINKHSSETSITATATGADGTGTGGYLSLRTAQYGSKYDFTAYSSTSNTGAGTSGLGKSSISAAKPDAEGDEVAASGAVGLDIVGTINGQAATGAGQVLTAKPANPKNPVNGLTLMITSSEPISSKITYSKGIGTSLRDMLVGMTSTKGIFATTQGSINTEVADFDKTIADMEIEITNKTDRLYAQFNSMESQLSQLQSQGNYLASMLGGSTSSSSS